MRKHDGSLVQCLTRSKQRSGSSTSSGQLQMQVPELRAQAKNPLKMKFCFSVGVSYERFEKCETVQT